MIPISTITVLGIVLSLSLSVLNARGILKTTEHLSLGTFVLWKEFKVPLYQLNSGIRRMKSLQVPYLQISRLRIVYIFKLSNGFKIWKFA